MCSSSSELDLNPRPLLALFPYDNGGESWDLYSHLNFSWAWSKLSSWRAPFIAARKVPTTQPLLFGGASLKLSSHAKMMAYYKESFHDASYTVRQVSDWMEWGQMKCFCKKIENWFYSFLHDLIFTLSTERNNEQY